MNVQRGTLPSFTRGLSDAARLATFSIVVFETGATFASGPFQMLLGSTMMMATIPAHVTLPGLIGNRISVLVRDVVEGLAVAR